MIFYWNLTNPVSCEINRGQVVDMRPQIPEQCVNYTTKSCLINQHLLLTKITVVGKGMSGVIVISKKKKKILFQTVHGVCLKI